MREVETVLVWTFFRLSGYDSSMSLPVMDILPPFRGVVVGVLLGCGYVGDFGTGAKVRRRVFQSCS